MNAIDKTATAGNMPPQKYMSQSQATSCFFVGKSGVDRHVNYTRTGKFRGVGDIDRLSWQTAAKYYF